jgi:hypothetical protein
MKKLLALLFVLGLTFYFDVESKNGHVYRNNSPSNCTILEYTSANIVIFYCDDRKAIKMSEGEFVELFGDSIIGSIPNAISVIVPIKKESLKGAPKIIF